MRVAIALQAAIRTLAELSLAAVFNLSAEICDGKNARVSTEAARICGLVNQEQPQQGPTDHKEQQRRFFVGT